MTLQSGDVVGTYRIDRLLSESGLERAYLAAADTGQRVVVKVPRFDTALNAESLRRFTRQAQTARKVSDARVVEVLDSGQLADGVPYVVEEYVNGGSLQDLIGRQSIDIGTAVHVCSDVAGGLDALHGAQIIHRSLTPACILLDDDLHAKVGSFALAKDRDASSLTRAGHTVGAAHFVAPEQIRGEQVSTPTDVYALGCVLYAALTGQPPYASLGGMKLLWAHLQTAAPDPRTLRKEIPADVSWALARALAKDPKERPATAGTFARLVQIAWESAALRSGGRARG